MEKITAYSKTGADAVFATKEEAKTEAAKVAAVEAAIPTLATKAEVAAVQPGVKAFESISGLLTHPAPMDLPKVITTAGHTTASDGAGVVYTHETWTPAADHVYGRVGIPLRGRWFIPRNVPTAPSTSPVKPAVDAVIARARTFVDAGTAIEWNADVHTPLHQDGPQRTPSGKWGLTCSSFVGMVVSGLAYQDTTYVAAANTRRDPRVYFGRLANTDPWQANRMARWAFANGDVWIPVAKDWQPGDVLFWGKQEPEGPGTTGTYFLNIYHVGLYAGGGMLMQSKSASDPQGVMHEPLSGMPDEIVLAWRPTYGAAVGTGEGGAAVDLSAYLRTVDAQGMFADKVATSTALNNRYAKAESDARYAQTTSVQAEATARQEAITALEARIHALEANGVVNPAVNRLDTGRVMLSETPVQVANGMSGFDVTFSKPFTAVPHISATVGKPDTPSTTLTVRMGTVTETGCRLWVNGLVSTGWVDWFATDGTQLPVGP